jgi:hypothetical protein
MKGLAGASIVVTGAARGIGLAVVRRLVAEGAEVAALDVDLPDDSATASASFWHSVDVSDETAVSGFFDDVAGDRGSMGWSTAPAWPSGSRSVTRRWRSGPRCCATTSPRSGGRLLADEFTYLRHDHGLNVVFPAPRLPWHIRTDMAPHLTPEHPDTRLLFPSELQTSVRCADQAAELVAVLIPDMSQPAGTVTSAATASVIDGCLRPAVTDHRAKLLDPGLDHVSLFTSLDQVTTPDGTPLAQVSLGSDRRAMHALLAMNDLPLFLVGIGAPAAIEVSVSAVRDALESL